jgi:L-threonylcarbamoyladenylate synthase
VKTLRLDGSKADDLEVAAELLRHGGIVAIPTETVYGLAADATNPAAVERIFSAKGRPSHNPLIVHVSDALMAAQYGHWPDRADELARQFWPGPLTMVVASPRGIAPAVLAGGDTVGLRAPAHPIARALIVLAGKPLAAPSANRSNALSPTSADAVLDTLDGRIDAVVDGGPCEVGLESTVLDLSHGRPRVLRHGVLTAEELGAESYPPTALAMGSVLRSPGQLRRHYAPSIPLLKRDTDLSIAQEDALLSFTEPSADCHWRRRLPADPRACARVLYGWLREAELSGASRIVVEWPPETDEWAAVRDRLERAQAKE